MSSDRRRIEPLLTQAAARPTPPDRRSNNCLIVAHCVLAQCVRATGLAKYFPAGITPVLQFCIAHDINIVQLPCPETLFGDSDGGIPRAPHGKAHYERLGFRQHCARLAAGQAAYISQLNKAGVRILGIVGMEFSPACAVHHLNRGRRIIRDTGVFTEELQRELSDLGLQLRFVGINQRALLKLDRDLKALLVDEAEHATQ